MNSLAEQHVCWQEQGRNALNFQQTGFVKVVAMDMSRAEMLAIMGPLEHRAEQSWTSHQSASEMNLVPATHWKARVEEVCSMR